MQTTSNAMNATPSNDGVYFRQIGSLPKPPELVQLLLDQADGQTVNAVAFEKLALGAMSANIARQIRLGYPLVVSGEPERLSFFHHIFRTLEGIGRVEGSSQVWLPADLEDFPEVAAATYSPAVRHLPSLRCTGEIAVRDTDAVYRELGLYKRALAQSGGWPPARAIVTEPSPGTLAGVIDLTGSPYQTRREIIAALAKVMRHRYRAVIEEGFTLSLDIPDGLMHQMVPWVTLEQFLADSSWQVTVLNEALEGLPLERVHAHACYGNYPSTDTRDEPLRDVIGPLLTLHVGTLFLEGSLSRHREDYLVLKELIDAGAVPPTLHFGMGVIDTKHYSVEDVEELAHRIVAMRQVLGGRLRAVSPDCGYETITGIPNIPPSVVKAKNALLPQAVAMANDAIFQKA